MGIAREVDTIHRDGTTFGIEIQVLFFIKDRLPSK